MRFTSGKVDLVCLLFLYVLCLQDSYRWTNKGFSIGVLTPIFLTTGILLYIWVQVKNKAKTCRIIEDYDRMIRIILLTTISCTISCPSFLPQFSIQCEKYSRQELWKHWLGAILWMQVIACYE